MVWKVSVLGCQFWVVNFGYQLSVVSCEFSVVSCEFWVLLWVIRLTNKKSPLQNEKGSSSILFVKLFVNWILGTRTVTQSLEEIKS